MTVFYWVVARSSSSVKKNLKWQELITRCHSSQSKTLLQQFKRSAFFQIYMGLLFHTKIFKQGSRVGIILITRAHGYIFVRDNIRTHI